MRAKTIAVIGVGLLAIAIGLRFWASRPVDLLAVAFEECAPFIQSNETPFREYFRWPISERARARSPVEIGTGQFRGVHIFTGDYYAIWGEDEDARVCMIRSLPHNELQRPVLFQYEGFTEEVTARAAGWGMIETENVSPNFPRGIDVPVWRSPGEDSLDTFRMVVGATLSDTDEGSAALVTLILAAPPGWHL